MEQHTPPAGWYDDPQGGPGQRYWDGVRWTNAYASGDAAAMQRSVAQASVAMTGLTAQPLSFWLGVISGLAMIVGGFGTWATALFASAAGTQYDGWIVIVSAAVMLGALWTYAAKHRRWRSLLALAAALVAGAVALYDWNQISAKTSSVFGHPVHVVQVGWGLQVCLGAAFMAALSAVSLAMRRP